MEASHIRVATEQAQQTCLRRDGIENAQQRYEFHCRRDPYENQEPDQAISVSISSFRIEDSHKYHSLLATNSAEQKILAAGRVSDGWQFYIPIENVLNQLGRNRQLASKRESPSISKNEYENEDEGLVYPLDVEVSVIINIMFRDYRYDYLIIFIDKI